MKSVKVKKIFNPTLKYMAIAVGTAMSMSLAQADVTKKQIGDLEIYSTASGSSADGKVTLTLMFNTADTMAVRGTNGEYTNSRWVDYGSVCSNAQPKAITFNVTDKDGNPRALSDGRTQVTYTTQYGCPEGGQLGLDASGNVKGYFGRMERLQIALIKLFADGRYLSDDYAIGIGHSTFDGSGTNVKDFGKIAVAAKPLTIAQRTKLIDYISNRLGIGYSSTAPFLASYGTAGAYMLGTRDTDWTKEKTSYYRDTSQKYFYRRYTNTYNGMHYDYKLRSESEVIARDDDPYITVETPYRQLGDNYISPITSHGGAGECGGGDAYGIFLLTDGGTDSTNLKLEQTRGEVENGLVASTGLGLQWYKDNTPNINYMNSEVYRSAGAYARALRDPNNPMGKKFGIGIRTAALGLGKTFNNLDQYKTKSVTLPNGSEETVVDCAKIPDGNAKSLCYLTQYGEGLGEGGFFTAVGADEIAKSIQSFANNLKVAGDANVTTSPSGTIVVPDDPYTLSSSQAIAYFPTVDPKMTDNVAVWPGNMKKYKIDQGTLWGKNDKRLFVIDPKYGADTGELNKDTQDIWSDKDYPGANHEVTSGGMYAKLASPNNNGSVRTLYVEDEGKLKKFSVANGKVRVTLVDNTASSLNDPIYNTQDVKRKLLNFLGYSGFSETQNVEDLTLANPSEEIKVLGASIHSAPAVISYGAGLDEDGLVTKERPDDNVLFGSMDGALHFVKAETGEEEFAFIPQVMLKGSNINGLTKGSAGTEKGKPNFGIDAPWAVATDYVYDNNAKKVKVDTENGIGMYAFGGFRLGGEGIYGLNLSNKTKPELAFSILPSTAKFARLGQIWAKPTRAKIKTSASDTGTEVLIFGGGYDTCYEDPEFQIGTTESTLTNQRGEACNTKSEAVGNAVYIIDAKTGKYIWSASGSTGADVVNTDMKNSIVAEVTALDRDNDGFMDHIYFADLGGQVFRADFTNAGFKLKSTDTAQAGFANKRVVRLLAPTYSGTETKYNRRFYERPVVSFYRNSSSNNLFALVNVISGDRSSPLSKLREDSKYADRVYGLMDSDVALAASTFFAADYSAANPTGFNNSFSINSSPSGVGDNNLLNIPDELGTTSANKNVTKAEKETAINILRLQNKGGKPIRGWFYPLTRFDGYSSVKYNKGIGKSAVIGTSLYTTVFNPDMKYGEAAKCSATIKGGSERQLYCLPYGICLEDSSTTGTGGYVRSGRGIQELTLGPVSDKKNNRIVLIGNRTLEERNDNRVDFGSDPTKSGANKDTIKTQQGSTPVTDNGDGSAVEKVYRQRFRLKPKTWYDVN